MNPQPVHLGLAVSAVTISFCVALGLSHAWGLATCRRSPRGAKIHLGLFAASLFVLFIPVQETFVIYYFRGMLGEFSVTTLILASAAFAGRLRWHNPIDSEQRFVILLGIAFIAIFFYPASLGLTRFDPYAWGYFSTPMLVGLGLTTCIALALRQYWAAYIMAGSLAIAGIGLLPSSNVWDYLLDPSLAIYSISALAIETARRIQRKPQPQTFPG